jgi:hypothetical protein
MWMDDRQKAWKHERHKEHRTSERHDKIRKEKSRSGGNGLKHSMASAHKHATEKRPFLVLAGVV